jgi:hypothetical protein
MGQIGVTLQEGAPKGAGEEEERRVKTDVDDPNPRSTRYGTGLLGLGLCDAVVK